MFHPLRFELYVQGYAIPEERNNAWILCPPTSYYCWLFSQISWFFQSLSVRWHAFIGSFKYPWLKKRHICRQVEAFMAEIKTVIFICDALCSYRWWKALCRIVIALSSGQVMLMSYETVCYCSEGRSLHNNCTWKIDTQLILG